MKRTGTTLAAATAAGASFSGIYAGENNTIKLALVGCGGRGTGAIADAFAANRGPMKLYAMADLFEHRLNGCHKALKQRFKTGIDVPPERRFLGFDGYKKAIDALDAGDVVVLTTHAAFRPLHFEYAVKKGVNVFMEKSFGVDAPAVRRLFKAAELSEKKNLKVGVGFMWRHSKARQEAISRIHDGMIGDVHTLRIYRVHGPVYCPPKPPDANPLTFQLQHPNSFTWVSSGFFIDWHCHNIDVACWAKGAWPVAAQGMGGRCYKETGNQFDHYTVEYTFADGAKLFAFSRHMKGCWQTYSDYIHGSKGSAVTMASLGDPQPKIYNCQDMVKKNVIWEFGKPDPNPYHVEWQVLLDAIRRNKKHNEARRAGEAEIVALMGRMAAHTGKYVTWDQVMKSGYQYVKNVDAMTYDTPAPIECDKDGIYPAPQPGNWNEI